MSSVVPLLVRTHMISYLDLPYSFVLIQVVLKKQKKMRSLEVPEMCFGLQIARKRSSRRFCVISEISGAANHSIQSAFLYTRNSNDRSKI